MQPIKAGDEVIIRAGVTDSKGIALSLRHDMRKIITEVRGPYAWCQGHFTAWFIRDLVLDSPSSDSFASTLEALPIYHSVELPHFGHVLRLPEGYVFNSNCTFISTSKGLL